MAAQPDPDNLGLTREVIEDWKTKTVRAEALVRGEGRSAADYPVLHAFAAHAHRQAEAALLLANSGLFMEAVPLVRSAYECAITASWIAALDDGLAAFGQEDVRSREVTLKLIREFNPTGADDPNNQEAAEFIKVMETSAQGRARQFSQICDDLYPVGNSGYLSYRVMSSLSHPSTDLANLYVDAPPSDDAPPTLRYTPRSRSADAWACLLFGSLVWAGQAVESREEGRGRKKFLRSMAKRGQIAAELRISDAAWVREAQAKAERRRRAR